VISNFADKETEKVFRRIFSKKLPHDIQPSAYSKLLILNALTDINDLLRRPGLHLEKLKGNRKAQWSIRINKQWRICFHWNESTHEAVDVEIADYH
jgi:toxin HigB-1